MAKRALITGITGQDGSYLAELLLSKGYEVHGLIRRASTFNTSRIDHLYVDPHEPNAKLFLHYGDLSDGARLVTLLAEIQPDEVYNLAAQSHVRVSFDEPEHTADTTGTGSIRLLEAVRMSGTMPRFYQASSSELYGATPPPRRDVRHARDHARSRGDQGGQAGPALHGQPRLGARLGLCGRVRRGHVAHAAGRYP